MVQREALTKVGKFSHLFDLRGIAVVGASADAERISGQPVRALTEFRCQDKVYPVNRRYGEVRRLNCCPKVVSVPQQCHVSFMAVAARLVSRTIEQCGEARHSVRAGVEGRHAPARAVQVEYHAGGDSGYKGRALFGGIHGSLPLDVQALTATLWLSLLGAEYVGRIERIEQRNVTSDVVRSEEQGVVDAGALTIFARDQDSSR